MALTIGRVGRDVTLGNVSEWSETGDGTVQVSGWIRNLSEDDASWLREQLLGLLDHRGERAVPVSTGHDDSRDGWYQVLDVEVVDLVGMSDVRGDRTWQATLRRLGYRVQPRYELHRYGGMWGNVHGITTAGYAGWASLPLTAEAVDLGADESWTRGSRSTESGTVALYTGGSQTLYDTVISAYVPIDDAYDGAPALEVDVTGSETWRTVVGADVRNLPTRWRLGNGQVRVKWSTGGGVVLQAWDGSAWDDVGTYTTPTRFQLSQQAGSTVASSPVAIAVLRNDPCAVSIRLLFDFDNGTSRIQWDLTARRGDRNIINVIKARASEAWGIVPSTEVSAVGCNVVTSSGSFRPISNDDAGHRWVMSVPELHIQNNDNGAWRVASSNTSVPWGLGVEVNGSNATGQNDADRIGKQFYVQATETLMIAGM